MKQNRLKLINENLKLGPRYQKCLLYITGIRQDNFNHSFKIRIVNIQKDVQISRR